MIDDKDNTRHLPDAYKVICRRIYFMKKIISTPKAPSAIGPYSQAVVVGDMVYTSGMIPIIPETGELETGDIKAQATQAIKNLVALLEASGASADSVVKTTVFIKDMNDFAAVNEVYATFFTDNFPARSCVEVARLPKDVKIEIEAVAIVK
jgi:2-iminobutanoate/2-iminopropanoate deaminase